MFDIKRLLSYAYPEAIVEVSTAENGVDHNVVLSNISKDNVEFVASVMEGAGYVYTPTGRETAALGVYEFTSISPYEHLAYGEEADYEHETNDLEDSGQDTSGSELSAASVTPIDGDGRAFRVLINPEMHKFAMKVYTGMLSNNENMANYGIFAYDLDNFLSMHMNSDPSFDEEGEEEDGEVTVPEAASVTVSEVASVFFNAPAEDFVVTFGKYMPETANAKFIGKVILGIIVKVLGGAIGKALLSAWQAKNKGAFERILFSATEYDFNSDTKKYKEYEFDDYTTYDIDLDDYTVESADAFLSNSEVAIKAGNVAIIKLLIAVIIKIMAGAIGRMLIDSWIKRDKKQFERGLMYVMLETMKYVPFKGYLESASVEVYEDGFSIDYASFEQEELEGSETARKKEKTGRGALLSALMKAMSGDTGDKAATAWDNGDIDTMVEILGKVTEKVLESMPYDESQDEGEEETTDEGGSDEPVEETVSEATEATQVDDL